MLIRQVTLRVLLVLFCILCLAFLICPLLIVVPISFSSSSFLSFPPTELSLKWYRNYFTDASWLDATRMSIYAGIGSAILSTVLGTLAASALSSRKVRFGGAIETVLMLPIVVPGIVLAIAAFSLYSKLQLVATPSGVILSHTVLALPFVVTMMRKGFDSLDGSLAEASYVMGASPFRTFVQVKLPILAPSLVASFILAFVTSWDEVVYAVFIGGGEATTLPLKMFSYLQTEINPTIAAVSSLLLMVVLVFGLLFSLVNLYFRKRALNGISISVQG